MWLPDELAERYSKHTPRSRYNRLFNNTEQSHADTFGRWGRGVSYHDLVLALNIKPEELPVISCKELFFRPKTAVILATRSRRFENFVYALRPEIHRGFFLASLELILQKPA
jgi:murein tripeptide amidase MpaA